MTSKMISCSECSWGRPWTCDSFAFTPQVLHYGHALAYLLGGAGHWTQDLLHTRQALHHRGYIMSVGLRPSLNLKLCPDDINTAIIRFKEKVSGNSDTKVRLVLQPQLEKFKRQKWKWRGADRLVRRKVHGRQPSELEAGSSPWNGSWPAATGTYNIFFQIALSIQHVMVLCTLIAANTASSMCRLMLL